MMTTKTTNPNTALLHVLTEVLNEPKQVPSSMLRGPYTKAFDAIGIQDVNDLLAIDPVVDFNDVCITEISPFSTPVKGTGIGSSPVSGSAPSPPPPTRQHKLSVVEKRTVLQLQLWFREYSARNQAIPPVRHWFKLVPVTAPAQEINATTVGTTLPSVGSISSGPFTLKSILMSKATVDQNTGTTVPTTVGSDGHRYLRIDMAQRTYTVARAVTAPVGALLDRRGANGRWFGR